MFALEPPITRNVLALFRTGLHLTRMLEMLIPASQEVPAFEPMRYASASLDPDRASLDPDSVMSEGDTPKRQRYRYICSNI